MCWEHIDKAAVEAVFLSSFKENTDTQSHYVVFLERSSAVKKFKL